MSKACTLFFFSLALGAGSVALAQQTAVQPVQLKFSRVVDLTLPIETNMAGIPGFKIYADNPSESCHHRSYDRGSEGVVAVRRDDAEQQS